LVFLVSSLTLICSQSHFSVDNCFVGKADLLAWADHICNVTMAGASHKERRHLFKTQLEGTWTFANWLTHAKGSQWHDAEAAVSTTENAISLSTSSVIRHVRGVPETCPACGSHRLSPERGFRSDLLDIKWERPSCTKCDWTGEPVAIHNVPEPPEETERTPHRKRVRHSDRAAQSLEKALRRPPILRWLQHYRARRCVCPFDAAKVGTWNPPIETARSEKHRDTK
jgi:hypothetical protein